MKQVKFKLTPIKLVSIILVSTFLAWIVYSASAATGSIALSSDKATITQGDTFVVTVTETSDMSVSIVSAKVTYDPAKVSLQGIDYTGSPFVTNGPESATGSNYVTVNRYLLEGNFPTGSNMVAKLTFKALAASGTSALGVSQAESSLISYQNPANILSSASGVNVTLASPTPPSVTAPPSANPASPTTQKTGSSATTTGGGTSSGNTSTGTQADPSLLNPTDTNAYQPAGEPVAPGKSRLNPSASLGQKIIVTLKRAAPAIVVTAVASGAVWFGVKKWHERPFGFSGPTPSAPGIGAVKPMTTKPSIPSDDHTPKTFSGV